jgi:hypothetical protein
MAKWHIVTILSLYIILASFDQYQIANGLIIGSSLTSFIIWIRDKGQGKRLALKWMKQSEKRRA